MKWVGISGSWKKINKQVENDLRTAIKSILFQNNGIVTGGALSVDYFATDETLKNNPSLDKLKIFLPTTLDIYAAHYRKRAKEGVITKQQAEDLIGQLNKVKSINSNALIENKTNKIVNKDTYFERNLDVVKASDELYAFQVNKSLGVEDTIEKAKEKGIPVKLFSYNID